MVVLFEIEDGVVIGVVIMQSDVDWLVLIMLWGLVYFLVGGGFGGFYVLIINLYCICGQVIGMVVCVGVVIVDVEFV